MTIGVPIVTCLPRLYQLQYTNSVPVAKNSQKQSNSKNHHWCTNRHTSTQSPPNTQSPRPRPPNTQSHCQTCRLSGDDFLCFNRTAPRCISTRHRRFPGSPHTLRGCVYPLKDQDPLDVPLHGASCIHRIL